MSKDIKKCAECRESEEGIWIANPLTKTHEEEFLCNVCFDLLSVRGGGCVVKGSQWQNEM